MEQHSLPLILVVNDDGVDANGIKALASVAQHFGRVVVVAPAHSQSGKSHAITFSNPLRYRQTYNSSNLKVYKVHGTPVDAFKVASCDILKDQKIDLLLSGINHGSNTSSSLIYSGTMAAVIEGCLNGIPSIGFSLADNNGHKDFEPYKMFVYEVIYNAMRNGLPGNVCLNVNIPPIPKNEILGYRITRQALNHWHEELDMRVDPTGRNYYWLTGHLGDEDQGEDTDEWAVQHNYISIQPVQVDMTAYHYMENLKSWCL